MNRNRHALVAIVVFLVGISAPAGEQNARELNARGSSQLDEGFGDVSALAGAGWHIRNNSPPLGTASWFQGSGVSSGGPFDAFSGNADSYVFADSTATQQGGLTSNWLITPELTFEPGARLVFITRARNVGAFPAELQVRLSTAGSSVDVGTAPDDVGSFDTLLLESLSNGLTEGYPTSWSTFTLGSQHGLPTSGTGRIAFRARGFFGAPGIGIDSVSYGTEVTFSVESGGVQSTDIDEPFPEPLVVSLKGASKVPLPLVPVTFTGPGVGAGAGFVVDLAPCPSRTLTTFTDSSGRATASAVANSVPGTYSVVVSAPAVPGPLVFDLTNVGPHIFLDGFEPAEKAACTSGP